MEVLVFSEAYAALSRPLGVGEVVVIVGQIDRRDDQPKLRATQSSGCRRPTNNFCANWFCTFRWRSGSIPRAGHSCGNWSWMRRTGEAAAGLLAPNGGGARSSVELAPADHYGVTWTAEFKTRFETFLGGASYELRATTQIARPKRKSWSQRN